MSEKDKFKEAMREIVREWMEDKYKQFGKWSFWGLVAWAFGWLIHLLFVNLGVPPPEVMKHLK